MVDREQLKADLDDGYTKIADLLLEALAMAKLTGVQKGICLFLWRRTYGWGIKEDRITLSEFAKACGTSEQYVSKQLKQLVNWNVIIRTSYEPGKVPTYTFNTRVTQWYKGCIDVQGLNECAIQGLYKCAIQGLHKCARVNQEQTQEPQGFAPSLKTIDKQFINNNKIIPSELSGHRPDDDSNFDQPTNQQIIAELTGLYRQIEGVTEMKGDFAFIGRLYNEHGYDKVMAAIDRLQKVMSEQQVKKPLLYLKGILENNNGKGGNYRESKARSPTVDRGDNAEVVNWDKFYQNRKT